MMEQRGLSFAEVEERRSAGLVNGDSNIKTKSVSQIVLEHSLTLFNLLNLFLAIAVLSVGSVKNALFMGIILANTGIGIFQELRSKRMVDKLSIMVASKAHVLREGNWRQIAVEEIVKDDVLQFKRGAQIPVDCLILEGQVQMNESLITGEADQISKKPSDELLSGSFVAGGECVAKALRVGKEGFAAKISREAKVVRQNESEIMRTLKQIITIISFIIIPLGIFLFSNQMKLPEATRQSAVVNTVAAMVSMIPEGLMLLTSTVLAVAVIRLSKQNVLVQQIYCIETLARVDVLCLDKTGTITSGKMNVKAMVGLEGTQREIMDAVSILLGSSREESPTVEAMNRAFHRIEVPLSDRIDFSSDKKWSGCRTAEGISYVMGAGEMIFREDYASILPRFEKRIGMNRAIMVAKSSAPFGDNEGLPQNLVPLGVVLIEDEIRPEAQATIDYFVSQGVTLKVISGDSVNTVSAIASRAGVPNAEKAVDTRNLSEEAMQSACEENAVFARVTPMQKRSLVKALQQKGHTVAMTGDGVNDVLAMKESDCSVAMASGSEAARNIAQLVLTTDDFSSMPKVVAEGRRSINNIQRSASLFLTKTIYAILIGFLFAVVNWRYPFEPIQMSFISTLTIGIPSVVLALEPNRERISGSFFYNIITRALAGGLTMALGIVLAYFAGLIFKLSYTEISTLAVVITAMTGIFLLLRISLPFNAVRTLLFVMVLTGLIFGVIIGRSILSLAPFSWQLAIASLWISAINAGVFFSLYALMDKIRKKNLNTKFAAMQAARRKDRAERLALLRERRKEEWKGASHSYKGFVRVIARIIFMFKSIGIAVSNAFRRIFKPSKGE